MNEEIKDANEAGYAEWLDEATEDEIAEAQEEAEAGANAA